LPANQACILDWEEQGGQKYAGDNGKQAADKVVENPFKA